MKWIISFGAVMTGVLGPAAVVMAGSESATGPGDRSPCSSPDQEVVLLYTPQPDYPHGASRFCIEGYVKVGGQINPHGRVSNFHVVESRPERIFDQAARVVEHWRFEPRCENGEPVAQDFTQVIEFVMDPQLRHRCPQYLEGEARELYSELMSMYSLHKLEYIESGGRPHRIRFPELAAPRFSGDLGKIERFHRDALRKWIVQYNNAQRRMEELGWYRLLDPGRLESDAGFYESRQILRDLHDLMDQIEHEIADQYEQLVAFGEALDVDPELRTHFLPQPVKVTDSNRGGPLDFDRRLLDEYEAVIHLLDEARDSWTVRDRQIHFDDSDQTARYRARMDAIHDISREGDLFTLDVLNEFWKSF